MKPLGSPKLNSLIRGNKIWFSSRNIFHKATALVWAAERPTHCGVAMCRRVPGSPVQPGIWQEPDWSPDQYLLNHHVWYLPLNILACTVAFLTSYGEHPEDIHIGWGLARDIQFGLKYVNDGSKFASSRNFSCHHSRIFSLTLLLNCCFRGGLARIESGSGNEYCWESSLIWQNQEWVFGDSAVKTFQPCLNRMLPAPNL